VTVAAAAEPAPLTFANAKEPTGVALPSPVVYTDDAGRLWLLRPNDPQPTRLDSPDRPFDPSMDPVFSSDHTWVAFLVTDAAAPAANMAWVKLDDLTFGPVIDFSSAGTPRRIAWLPGHTDTLIVAAELAGGGSNVYFYRTDTSELPVTLFAADQQPARIDAIVPAPTGALVAIQATGADGDPDTYLVDTTDPAAPVMTQVGPNTGNDPDQFLAWSPAGDRIIMQSGTATPLLYIADANGTTPLGTAPLFTGDPNAGTAPQWSADAGWIAAFDGDPAAGGQLRLFDGAGNSPCDPIANAIAFDWSPTETRLWALVAPPNEQVRLVTIGTDCAQQDITTFDAGVDKLLWSPNGSALALVDHADGGTTVSLLIGDQITPIDPAPAGVAITDVLSWSPGGELLALYAGGPTVSLWVVTPGSATPTTVSGSTLPEGASYVTRVWWG
jgi:dipeptidyl aminopeptidase/acylaminoacyl peptidase